MSLWIKLRRDAKQYQKVEECNIEQKITIDNVLESQKT